MTNIEGRNVNYDAEGWAWLTGDGAVLDAPSGDGINRENEESSPDGPYKYDKLKRTKNTDNNRSTTTAKTVFKRHAVFLGSAFLEDERQRNFDLYETAGKNGTHPISPTSLNANPWAKGRLDTDSNSSLNSTIRVMRSETPSCSSSGANHTCRKDTTQANSGNDNSEFVDNTSNCTYCSNGCFLCTITGPCGHTYSDVTASQHTLQASCSETDENGNTCTVTNFYACESHTHQYTSLITGACGVHTGIASSDASNHAYTVGGCTHSYYMCQASGHEWGTAPCGDATHVGYLCQIAASDHEWVYEICPSMHAHYECDGADHSLQASCSETNVNGDSCTVTNFYACQSHTHQYLITCGNTRTGPETCDGGSVTSSTQHRATCTHGHSYWNCNPWHRHYHKERTCTACNVRYYRCLRESCIAGGLHKW